MLAVKCSSVLHLTALRFNRAGRTIVFVFAILRRLFSAGYTGLPPSAAEESITMKQLLTIFLLWCAPVGCFAQTNDAEYAVVEEAVKKLEALDAYVGYNDEGDVESVWFPEEASFKHLKLIASMNHLTSLSIGKMDLGRDGLKHIKQPAMLEEFTAEGEHFTDAELQQLQGLRQLEILSLSGTAVTDVGVRALTKLSLNKLEVLDLSGTAVSDAAITAITKIPNLKTIFLDSTAVTADGFTKLKAARPDLEIPKYWKYFCGFQNGRAVLEIGPVFIFFPEKDNKRRGGMMAGGGGGGVIRISKSRDESHLSKTSGGSSGFNQILVSVEQEKDGAVFSIEGHTIEIRKEGTELIIDGDSFPIPQTFLSVTIDSGGVGKPQIHEKRPLPKRKSLFDDSD